MEETTSAAVGIAARRVLIPAVRLVCWSLVMLALIAILILTQTPKTGAASWQVLTSLWLVAKGIVPLSTMVGLVGLLFLPTWEKVALFVLMLAVAWASA